MTKKLFLSLAVLVLGFGLASCASGQTTDSTDSTQPGDSSTSRNLPLDMVNKGLAELSYSPGNAGWDYKATAVPAQDFNAWATKYKPQIEQALSSISDDYVLQVTGHTCSIGPRDRQADGRPGNVYFSTQRAQQVLAALRNAGIPATKLVVKGVADDEPATGVDAKDRMNRRVTFKVVPKAK